MSHPCSCLGSLLQNVPSAPESAAVTKHGVHAAGEHAEAERVDTDGLPFVGVPVWPGQSYYTTINKVNGEHGVMVCAHGVMVHEHVLVSTRTLDISLMQGLPVAVLRCLPTFLCNAVNDCLR